MNNFGKVSNTSNSLTEEAQLAWATADSMQLEQERWKRNEQERKDYELALAISRAESGHLIFKKK